MGGRQKTNVSLSCYTADSLHDLKKFPLPLQGLLSSRPLVFANVNKKHVECLQPLCSLAAPSTVFPAAGPSPWLGALLVCLLRPGNITGVLECSTGTLWQHCPHAQLASACWCHQHPWPRVWDLCGFGIGLWLFLSMETTTTGFGR